MAESTLILRFLALFLAVLFIEPLHCLEANSKQPPASKVKKRSYYSWTVPRPATFNSLSLYNAGKVFKPAPYAIARPYYVPVYGVAGGNLIFYPPQPLYINAGTPVDNPGRPSFQGPSYLPPTTTPNPLADRLGGFNEDDDAPIWGVVGPSENGGNKEYAVVPTRPPSAAAPNRPPLLHGLDSNEEEAKENRRASNSAQPQTQAGPSNCVWAIVSCCSGADPNSPPQNCFEQRGCPGPFWGSSPCTSGFAKAALDAALSYYNGNPAGK